jgi:uncharacterized spore protein YtfJ
MNATKIIEEAGNVLAVKRVFGDPIERDGVTIVPVARVRGGGGGGEGTGPAAAEGEKGQAPGGWGGGWGAQATPAGVFVIKGGDVAWQPAVDVNRLAIGGQIAFIIALLVLRSILKRR